MTYVLHRQALLATVLGIALAVNFLVAALVGSLIPLVLRWLRADPAVASSVFVTACTDMCGFLVFLGLLSLGLRCSPEVGSDSGSRSGLERGQAADRPES